MLNVFRNERKLDNVFNDPDWAVRNWKSIPSSGTAVKNIHSKAGHSIYGGSITRTSGESADVKSR